MKKLCVFFVVLMVCFFMGLYKTAKGAYISEVRSLAVKDDIHSITLEKSKSGVFYKDDDVEILSDRLSELDRKIQEKEDRLKELEKTIMTKESELAGEELNKPFRREEYLK